MTFRDYQNMATTTAIYPNKGNNITYTVLGLAGEAGEVAEKVKKVIRDKNGVLDQETKNAIAKELGDVLWYVSAVSTEIGFDLGDVAQRNIDKLFKRKEKGCLQGSGDDRENK
jgi:NTP pyrophosphatase (non-canonical NTP hydrolase)